MTDSFNAHEILSRLRAKPNGNGLSSGGNTSLIPNGSMNNSYLLSNTPNNPHLNPNHTNTSSNNSLLSNSGGNTSPNKTMNTSKIIKTPATLTLTPAQRQDNLTMRNELEKEVKRLQDEIQQLKQENKQLKEDKEDVERQFIDFKVKHDHVVMKLRSKIADLSLHPNKPHTTTVSEGTGKLYPPHPQFASPKQPTGNHHGKVLIHPGNHYQTPTGAVAPPPAPIPVPPVDEGFREPTFSELMRRSSVDPPDFKDSLRRMTLNNNNAPPSANKNSAGLQGTTGNKVTTQSNNSTQSQQPQQQQQSQQRSMNQSSANLDYLSSYPEAAPPNYYNSYNNDHQNYEFGSPRGVNNNSALTLPTPAPSTTTTSAPNTMNTVNGSVGKKPLNRTMTFFDSNFMKGNNVSSGPNTNNNYDGLNNGSGNLQNPNSTTNSGNDYPTLRHGHGSMYSIVNNYPGFVGAGGGGGGNVDYEGVGAGGGGNTNSGGNNQSHANLNQNNPNQSASRKMSLPEASYLDGGYGGNNDFPVVEIDLSM